MKPIHFPLSPSSLPAFSPQFLPLFSPSDSSLADAQYSPEDCLSWTDDCIHGKRQVQCPKLRNIFSPLVCVLDVIYLK